MNQFWPAKLQQKTTCLILSLLGALIIAAGLALLSQPGPASANTSYDAGLARAAYPHLSGTDLECTLCHTRVGVRTLNVYGSAYRSNGRNAAALTTLENIDTDGDGYFNIDEINALTSPADAADHPHDDLLARQNYPDISATRLDDCALCHSSGSSLNPYGQSYRDNGRNLAAFGLIEAVDSDGDGYTNLAEITALTFPGDAGDYPAQENEDMVLARQKYPAIVTTRLDSCSLCHTGSGADLNDYGLAYQQNGRDLSAFDLIQAQDADSDGFTNLIEITELTFPGNPADYPVAATDDMAFVRQTYPELAATILDSCSLCHTAIPNLNSYGRDYLNLGRNQTALSLIEAFDSDGDRFTNLDEIGQLNFPGDDGDHPHDDFLAIKQYPELAGSRLDSCTFCHTDDLELNGYGAAYLAHGRDLAAFSAIENSDSDGDEFTNLDEITARTFPGDAADHPHDDQLLLKKYPHLAGTRLDSCNMCHCSCGELLDYGRDYLAHGRNLAAFGLIEGLDSDGDGYTNLAEIEALTFPSNASDTPLSQHNHQTLVLEQYPHLTGSRLEECNLCHASEFSRNPYGAAYAGSGYDFTAIESLDSDGDGFANIDEINLLTFPGDEVDYPDDLALALAAYPHLQSSDLNACELCHTGPTGSALNPYGQAYQTEGRNPAAFAAIENFDSDADHHSNLIELTLLAFPGDPDDYPDKMSILLFKYPHLENTSLHTCAICHTDDWGVNPYGQDYFTAGANWEALALIEAFDSDQDDYPNLAEINALTFPGDAASSPAGNTTEWRVYLPLLLK